MAEEFDLGRFLKKAVVFGFGLALIGIAVIAALTLIGVIVAIPLFKKGAQALLQQKDSHSGKLKWEDEEGSHKYKW